MFEQFDLTLFLRMKTFICFPVYGFLLSLGFSRATADSGRERLHGRGEGMVPWSLNLAEGEAALLFE